ncbi:hypothetical protein NM208_g14124 [Fusarium decemcellulare]|uniref:Uncharacterized protein n=1 Tax=Fusarium decemcellulare TaxID=57161 RepID=A0ACC1RJU0_9HYPO|nr:hypothetical protein NM208_g14124 [Fusarium decemcellulare]
MATLQDPEAAGDVGEEQAKSHLKGGPSHGTQGKSICPPAHWSCFRYGIRRLRIRRSAIRTTTEARNNPGVIPRQPNTSYSRKLGAAPTIPAVPRGWANRRAACSLMLAFVRASPPLSGGYSVTTGTILHDSLMGIYVNESDEPLQVKNANGERRVLARLQYGLRLNHPMTSVAISVYKLLAFESCSLVPPRMTRDRLAWVELDPFEASS